MVDHREGVIASSERQFATPHSPSSHSDRSLSWAYRDSSADLKPLQWISPDNARSQPLGPVGRVCSSLLRCAVENQLEGAGNIDLVTGQNELYILLSIIYRGNEYPIILCWDTKK